MKKNLSSTITVLVLVGLGLLLIYIRSQLGDIPALCFLFFLAGFATGILGVALGGRMNDDGQRAFIDGLSQLKSVMAPAIKEDARTRGAMDRASIQLLSKGAASFREPSEQESELAAFYRQFEDSR